MKRLVITITVLLIGSGIILFFLQSQPQELEVSQEVQDITALVEPNKNSEPVAVESPIVEDLEAEEEMLVEDVLQNEENLSTIEVEAAVELSVPFIVQAPHGDWSERYKETCEEASILMIHEFYEGSSELTQDQMKAVLDPLTDWGDMKFGGRVDTTLEETALYLTEYLGYDESRIKFIENPTADDLKALLANDLPVVIPAAGRELGNKFFQTPGPTLPHACFNRIYTK